MTIWNSQTEYLQAEWDQFFEHPVLGQRTLDAVAGRQVAAALDVGCGAGQELIPFVTAKEAAGIGVDIRYESLLVARSLLASVDVTEKVSLVCARAEALPVRSESFDAVVCRSVLVYTDVRLTLAELRRVMRPGAVVLVQVKNLRREVEDLLRHLYRRNARGAQDALRHMGASFVYHLRGRQPTNSWTRSEIFFSRGLLTRELARVGLTVIGEVPHGNPRSFAVVATVQR